MGPSLSTCSEPFRKPPNKRHCHTFPVPLPLPSSLPFPVVAKGTLAATANVAVAVSRVLTHPSPVVAKSTVAPSPAAAKGTLAATAQVAVAVPSPVLAKGPLAAMAKKAVVAPVFASAPLPVTGTYRLRPDNLGKSALSSALLLDSGLSFQDLCVRHHGKSCIADPTLLPHPAAPILAALRSTGAPANLSSTQWTEAQRDAAAKRGPHKGTHKHIEFLRTEFFNMVQAGQWLVLPY
jgi:hypothetical protein